MTEIEHGSAAAYHKCRRRPEGSCQECKRAAAAYVKQWRERQPAFSRARQARHRSAIRRAHARLAEMYPDEFKSLLAEELTA
jgi:hypothetical protein